MSSTLIEFDQPRISPSIIMVAGVGGGGSNAVNHMYDLGIRDVSFMVCNTDRQALLRSPVPIKVRLGETLTEGLGAGNNPERGREAALESLDEITRIFKENATKMVFVTAGMGGGTGTGAAPVIAKAAKELGILTVAIVTLPFRTEGPKRMRHANEGIEELYQHVDSLLLINNENIQAIFGTLPLSEAFGKADDILANAAKSIAEIITRESKINVDFADVRTVMSGSGVALMGSGRAKGENRAMEAAVAALSSPLLNHNSLEGARDILINITSGVEEITFDDTVKITEYIQQCAGERADLIWGAGMDETLGEDLQITLIATGFDLETIPTNNGRAIAIKQSVPEQDQVQEEFVEDESMYRAQGSEEFTVENSESEAKAESVAAKPRPRWTPPTPVAEPAFIPPKSTITSRPLHEATSHNPLAVGSQPAPSPEIEARKQDATTPYANVEELESMPSFKRRKMQLKGEVAGGRSNSRTSNVALKDENEGKEFASTNSLFD